MRLSKDCLLKIHENALEGVTVACNEAHAHSALKGCVVPVFGGSQRDVTICQLAEELRHIRMSLVGAITDMEGILGSSVTKGEEKPSNKDMEPVPSEDSFDGADEPYYMVSSSDGQALRSASTVWLALNRRGDGKILGSLGPLGGRVAMLRFAHLVLINHALTKDWMARHGESAKADAVRLGCAEHFGPQLPLDKSEARIPAAMVDRWVRSVALTSIWPSDEPSVDRGSLVRELARTINAASAESYGGSTPDHILAELVADVIEAYGKAVRARDRWWGRGMPEAGGEGARAPGHLQRADRLEDLG